MKSLFKKAGLTALVAASAIGLVASNAKAAEPIKIGSFLAVTGGASFLGDPEKKTLDMYVEKINAEGGVLGRKLELIVYDSGGNPKKAVPFAKRLINDDKVDILLAGSTTGATMAVIPIVEKAGIPFISFGGAGVIINPVKKWVFKTPHTDTLAVKKIYTDMKARGISKVGLLSGSGGFDKSCRKNVLALAAGAGMSVVADETHGKGDTDMTAQITKIKNAAGVQAMLYCGFGGATSIVAKNFKQLGVSIPHYQTHGSASKSFIKNADGGAEGVRLPAAALVVVDALPDSHPQKKVASAYKKMYEAKAGSEISSFGGHAYDGLMLAVEAITRAGSTDKAAVLAELEKTNNFIGVDGIYTMSPTDHLGLDEASFVMVEVKGGDWKMLK
ncbi:MAG: ABC transporter substrate-binding protein [Rhodospirillaceae bacterium]|jgi:branched-chain amino acid transport system substrate-binding protein|nr:ABC transporter substrate-binding protein [Rhodospirillaceae bacterium]MBT5242728.1 ABC transporter substrate-binding protein [Rhodospirillaceae bacterium]MBT5561541.1 ABC transporter substrate-binding protein [Rhodospirillaceae bacterium]MBT6241861.1 ABC transporter substrate-binding protein [Rhodospirillaceae bacterium]MBT7138662.1 ABC transporter substrate-binding protein [Rhodospirillaceae bacterium]